VGGLEQRLKEVMNPVGQVKRTGPMTEPTETHYRIVAKALAEGRVIPLLGAGVNLCGRPTGTGWQHGRYLPSGVELAAYLARVFDFPTDQVQELLRVSQYAAVMTGSGPLYEELHRLLDADYQPTKVHNLLASIPEFLRRQGLVRYQLIVTTNYDDALERAFRAAGEEFDVVWYVAEGRHRGKFLHITPDGDTHLIERPNEYNALSLSKRTVILKIHGAVDRLNPERDSYVITEDHYIDYLTRTDIAHLVPVGLAARLRRSHFLFLGYSMADWNLRVILYRIWGEQELSYKSWSIQLNPKPLEEGFWHKRGVEILHAPLEEYIDALAAHLGDTQPVGVAS
jgi:SIR2-like domain